MSGSRYPRELYHPNGFKTMVAFSAEDESRMQKEFETFRNEHQAANAAAHEGRDAAVSAKTASK